MKLPAYAVFLASLILLIGSAVYFRSVLPDEVVTQFNEQGKPSGRGSAHSLLITLVAFGAFVPIFISALLYVCRFLPPSVLNTPDPEYWRQPQHFKRACEILYLSSLWFGSAMVLWMIWMMSLVVSANQSVPPRLGIPSSTAAILALVMISVVWTVYLLRRFRKRDGT